MDASFAIDVVESGYRVVQGADAWALGVLAAARGALDDGLGLQLFVLQATPGDAFTAELTQNLGGPASVVDFSLRALTSYPPPFVRMLLEDVGRFGSSSEFIRRFVPVEARPALQAEMERAGLVDGVSATFPDGVSGLIVIGAPSPRRRRTYATQRRLWDRLLPHLATGWRLRRRLEQGIADDPQAVLTPSGEVAYAVGRAATLEGRVALARAVVQAETARGPLRRADPEVALDLWRGLVSGRWSLVDRVESDGRRFIVAYQNPAGLIDPRRLSEREDAVATLASRGVPLKQIAYTLGLSAGTVAAYLGAAPRKLGVAGRVELARLGHLRESEALELAVATAEAGGAATAVEPAGQRLVAVEEPGITSDDGLLGRGERRVATLSASGLSNDEIARLLDRSPKTIANQLASIFAKLGVGSRAALAHRLSQRRGPASSD